MGLNKVWLATLSDGLLRADQVVGLTAHATPALTGKPPRWLLDATIRTAAGSGSGDGWDIGILHRTLIQTPAEPVGAPEALARLLARLDGEDAAGLIAAVVDSGSRVPSVVRFAFRPFEDDEGSGA
ncbi:MULTISPECIES: hypothetical protein [unclassified Amycolatopsis]|uniref:hypothetical protein n=1 Tax=unclassified Amycolatopsis TaxID=2618356 RepID=UPI0028765285|nr:MULTISPECIES: hypothetical protein [unclassified Amycolatopsis]MDS0134429.1 hypothetical protein [Amycolatopsis sp. 505]MDS0147777.1 hypothetical protein [Amycolatopsis sp. CM201R]